MLVAVEIAFGPFFEMDLTHHQIVGIAENLACDTGFAVGCRNIFVKSKHSGYPPFSDKIAFLFVFLKVYHAGGQITTGLQNKPEVV